MAYLLISIDIDNDAFAEDPVKECRKVVGRILRQIDERGLMTTPQSHHEGGGLDSNGNTVAHYTVDTRRVRWTGPADAIRKD